MKVTTIEPTMAPAMAPAFELLPPESGGTGDPVEDALKEDVCVVETPEGPRIIAPGPSSGLSIKERGAKGGQEKT